MARAILSLALVAVVFGMHINPWASCPAGHKEFVARQWDYGAMSTNWGSICPAYATCNNGARQSPIDIPTQLTPSTKNLELYLGTTDINIVRVDGVVSMPVNAETSILHWGHKNWTLEHIEFHHPSEHTFNNEHSAFEVQLYFGRTDEFGQKRYAAVAQLYDCDKEDNLALDTLSPLFPRVTTCKCGNGRTERYEGTLFQELCDCGPLNNNTVDGLCRTDCTLARCGDGFTDRSFGEECDDGKANTNDRLIGNCRANCTLPKCGDAITDAGEQCDDGFQISQPQNDYYYRCDSFCQFSCGNGIIDPYMNTTWQEECDFGSDNSLAPDAVCRTNCRLRSCGDGVVDPGAGEVCDLGQALGGNSTSPNCRTNCTAPICGDGIWDDTFVYPDDFVEQCDNGGINDTNSACTFDCLNKCGNGIVGDYIGEQCDDGPDNSDNIPDACRTTCRNATCGDGIIDSNEQCDEGPILNGNGVRCSSTCQLICGNEFVDPVTSEECDNGPRFFLRTTDERPNGNSDERPNACREDCTFAKCGDNTIDPLYGEQCDDGPLNNQYRPNACRVDCRKPCCGDGITDPDIEECDHGAGNGVQLINASFPPLGFRDRKNPDGNNALTNWGCSSDCLKLCGNGIRGDWDSSLGDGEQCDDGTLNSISTPDKCRPDCKINFCGDGVTDFDEECDDGEDLSVCDCDCKKKYCGDGKTDYALGEECDHGIENSYSAASTTGCSPICTFNRCGLTQNFGVRNTEFHLSDLVWGPQTRESPSPTYPGEFFYYKGSQTKPPCTENVEWLVSATKQRIGLDQLAKWDSGMNGMMNARPTQHLTPSRFTNHFGEFGNGLFPSSSCGDGVREATEECDAGMYNDDLIPNRCRKNCQLPSCGDNVVDQGEECDTTEDWCDNCEFRTMVHGHKTDYNNTHTCPYWNYDFAHLWGDMGEGCESCNGMRQSPINIDTNCEGAKARPLSLKHPSNVAYVKTPVVLFNTGNNIYFPVMNGGTFSFHGKTYVLTHLEFHYPSEHTIGGKRFDFEVQLHHQAQNPGVQQKAILAVLFEKGQEANSFLDQFWNQLPPSSECRCGNGIKEDQYYWPDGTITKEECDAGKDNSDVLPNHCRTDCRKPRCGDGIVDHNEACDWGVANSDETPSHCREDCTMPYCGDLIVDMGEQCDDGNGNNIDACDNNCRFTCGNGILEGDEECDDGANNSPFKANACRTNCKLFSCGDNIIDQGEECDNGDANNDAAACRRNCTITPCDFSPPTNPCGNGRLDVGEECDNGVGNSDTIPNACRKNCQFPSCGDNVRDNGEQCDDSRAFPAEQTQCFNCKVVCGNGFLEQNIGSTGYDEECDHGIMNSDFNPNACRENCRMAYCGDGVTDTAGPCFEECDDGPLNSPTGHCRPNCRRPYCGDGVLDEGEQCDDGNMIDGDACNCNCQKTCGNGRIDEGEACDDGEFNGRAGGCCRENCVLPMCGDGTTDPGEECDDGEDNLDGPNHCRMDCTLPRCGDGHVDFLFGEKCDLGPLNDDLAVDGCSPRCTPNVCGQSLNPDVSVDPIDVIPSAPGVYCYDGSVNHPPCTEDAQWFVFAAPQTISQCQLNHWMRIIGDNAREVQPLNGRTVSFLTEETRCGDGLVEGNEECDEGPMNSDFAPNACRRNCRRAYCGDGVQDASEQCDGTPNCGPNCRLSCPAGSSCPNCNGSSQGGSVGGGDSNNINVNFGSIA